MPACADSRGRRSRQPSATTRRARSTSTWAGRTRVAAAVTDISGSTWLTTSSTSERIRAMTDLQQRREAIVREHMDSENVQDFDTTIHTFGHPRYELIPTGDVFDGEE